MRDSRKPTQPNGSPGSGEDEVQSELAERFATQLRAARRERGMSQQALAEAMSAHGFSWRQTTVAKTEAGARPLLFTESIVLCSLLGKNLDFFLKKQDKLDVFVDESAGRIGELHKRLHRAEAAAEAARLGLAWEECAVTVATSLARYRDGLDSGVLRHELDAVVETHGVRVIRLGVVFETVSIQQAELDAIDAMALRLVAESVDAEGKALTAAEVEESGAESLIEAAKYLKTGEADPDFLEAMRHIDQWSDRVCFELVELIVERIHSGPDGPF